MSFCAAAQEDRRINMSTMDSSEIDTLLERYLQLLHEYTTLRHELGTLQAGMYQNIARANFSADRGMRYGQDFYDDRMQASRRLKPTGDEDGRVSLEIAKVGEESDSPQERSEEVQSTEDSQTTNPAPRQIKKPGRKDPIQWFGLLTPLPLRQAQAQSIKAVEAVIPRLVSVNAEMQQVEIEVRRARKKRAKAEVVTARQQSECLTGQKLTA